MTEDEWRELLSDPENWPDGDHLPEEWKQFYWVTKEVWTDTAQLWRGIEDKGLGDLYSDVLVKLGYTLVEHPSGRQEIQLASKEQTHSIRRVARFLLEEGNEGKSSQQLASELHELGCQAQ